ncbi:hypothetical protein ABZP36_020567 [Zizania latifolia]
MKQCEATSAAAGGAAAPRKQQHLDAHQWPEAEVAVAKPRLAHGARSCGFNAVLAAAFIMTVSPMVVLYGARATAPAVWISSATDVRRERVIRQITMDLERGIGVGISKRPWQQCSGAVDQKAAAHRTDEVERRCPWIAGKKVACVAICLIASPLLILLFCRRDWPFPSKSGWSSPATTYTPHGT